MKKELKLTYLKKSKKFLDKHKDAICESEIDELIIKFVKSRFYNIEQNIDYKALQGYNGNYFRSNILKSGTCNLNDREVKKEASLKKIPIVVISNLGQEDDIQKAKKLGAVDYLIKSNFSFDEMLDKIKTYL